jgi:hypothetical protein
MAPKKRDRSALLPSFMEEKPMHKSKIAFVGAALGALLTLWLGDNQRRLQKDFYYSQLAIKENGAILSAGDFPSKREFQRELSLTPILAQNAQRARTNAILGWLMCAGSLLLTVLSGVVGWRASRRRAEVERSASAA